MVCMITSGFWDEGDSLAAAEPWEDVLNNGASLIRDELIEEPKEAIAEWNWGSATEKIAFVRKLYQRKIAQPETVIELTSAEVTFLESLFQDPKKMYQEIARLYYQAHREIDV